MTESTLLSPEQVEDAKRKADAIRAGLDRVILGQEELNRLVLVACLARGHILLEGLPGLGKTELVKALSALLGLDYGRLQFSTLVVVQHLELGEDRCELGFATVLSGSLGFEYMQYPTPAESCERWNAFPFAVTG